MLPIITSLVNSLELFLCLKNKLFYYDIIQKSKARQNEIIKQIEDLRSKGDSNSADSADLLRLALKREKDELEYISAFYNKIAEKQTH
jgi:hypothetical protein